MMTKTELKVNEREKAKFVKLFEAEMKDMLPTMKMFKDDTLGIPCRHVMYSIENVLSHTYRDDKKTLWFDHGNRAYLFIGTEINPNGIDSSGRIGRTWDISFDVDGTCRYYRRKRIDKGVRMFHFYGYAESPEGIIEKFRFWLQNMARGSDHFRRIIPVVMDK